MRVLHYIWSANFGGIEKLVLSLAMAQMKDETNPHILVGCRKGELINAITDSGVPHTYAGLKSGMDMSSDSYHQIKQLMKEHDIIHMHTFNPLIAYAAIRSGKKLIYTVHGNFNLGRKAKWNDYILNLLKSIFLRRKDVLVTFNSNWAKEVARKKYSLPRQEYTVVYNGILPKIQDSEHHEDLNQFKALHHDKFIIGTAGRFNQSKCIDRLIRSFALFSSRQNNARLLLVGDGTERNNLEQLVDQLNIRDKTTFTGFRTNVGDWQRLMNVCVIPGQYEAFGLAALETMQKGIPTFVFDDAGGMLEVIGQELSEYIVNSEPELAEKFMEFYTEKKDQDSLLKAALQKRAGLFTFPLMVANYRNCYQKILQS